MNCKGEESQARQVSRQTFCTGIDARTFLSPELCKIENGVGVVTNAGQDEVQEDAHQSPRSLAAGAM